MIYVPGYDQCAYYFELDVANKKYIGMLEQLMAILTLYHPIILPVFITTIGYIDLGVQLLGKLPGTREIISMDVSFSSSDDG